jgi:hypothetical protein
VLEFEPTLATLKRIPEREGIAVAPRDTPI